MQAELVAVPTRGVERWLTQRLSAVLGASPGRSDGVCANVEFPFPGRLVNGAVAAAVGVDRTADPWLAARLGWVDSLSFARAPRSAAVRASAVGRRLALPLELSSDRPMCPGW